jgi:hypothetical protein
MAIQREMGGSQRRHRATKAAGSDAMASQREMVGVLTRPKLQKLCARFQLENQDKRINDQLVEAAASPYRATLAPCWRASARTASRTSAASSG